MRTIERMCKLLAEEGPWREGQLLEIADALPALLDVAKAAREAVAEDPENVWHPLLRAVVRIDVWRP